MHAASAWHQTVERTASLNVAGPGRVVRMSRVLGRMCSQRVRSVTRAAAARQSGIAGGWWLCEPDACDESGKNKADIPMTELGDSLERMSFMQLLLLFGVVTSYVVALGGMLSVRLRQRAALLALLLAAAFTSLTDPWVHGALLMVFVIAGLGLFVVLSWLLARLLGPREVPPEVAQEVTVSPALPLPAVPDSQPVTQPVTQPLIQHPSDPLGAAPKAARGARAAR